MTARFVAPFFDTGSGLTPSDGSKLTFKNPGLETLKNTFSDSAGLTPKSRTPVTPLTPTQQAERDASGTLTALNDTISNFDKGFTKETANLGFISTPVHHYRNRQDINTGSWNC